MSASAANGSQVVVIGAGIGGLAAAIRLRAAGLEVTLLERAPTPGGKLRQLAVGEHSFDAGPSVLTMPWVFAELFAAAGERLSDWVTLRPVDPVCRHFFADGLVLDLAPDHPVTDAGDSRTDATDWTRSADEIGRLLGEKSRDQYHRFRRYTQAMYRAVKRPFLQKALPSTPLALPFTHEWKDVLAFLRVDARRSVWQSLCERFDDEHLRVLFARYATYAGSDPFVAPATLNVISHVELAMGVFTVEGGMYRLAQALSALAERLGVRLRYTTAAERIELDESEQRAVAVHAGGARICADAVVANCDVAHLFSSLLSQTRCGARLAERLARHPASLSAHLLLVAVRDAAPLGLCHHNVFFSPDYAQEFAALAQGRVPEEPTVYLCRPDPARWFFLVNAPPLPDGAAADDPAQVRARIQRVLMRHGIDLDRHAVAERAVTPADFAALFPGSRGALYGTASNSRMAAFRRPPNRVLGLKNLYCVGGSTHPGAGVPMVALSAQISTELLLQKAGRRSTGVR